MTYMKPSKEELTELLNSAKTIAIVGASANEEKAAHSIPKILHEAGFTVIPVNPMADEIIGQKVYRSLADIPVPVDIVNVFRPSEEAEGIAEQAMLIGAKTLWLQSGITSAEARCTAVNAGMFYIEDICLGETMHALGIRK